MSNALATQQSTALRPASQFDLSPQTFDQALEFSKYLAASDMVPKQYRGKPGDCLIAMQWGYEIGMKPLQALQSIAAVNGRPSIYGDAGKAMLLAAGCQIDEDDIEKVRETGRARCKITRPGRKPTERTFSIEDAKTARLWGKEGPWTNYPYRQMAWRAFWFAARDAAADLLRGMGGAEELQDIPADTPAATQGERHMGQADVVLPDYDQAKFDHNVGKWAQSVVDGIKTMADVLAWLKSKAAVTPSQEKQLQEEVAKRKKSAVEPALDATAPAVDPAKLEADIKACKDLDKLYELGSLIEAVTEPSLQATLTDHFDARAAELESS